jgi:hypothetical protein
MGDLLQLHNARGMQCRHAASAWLAVTNSSISTGVSLNYWAECEQTLALRRKAAKPAREYDKGVKK